MAFALPREPLKPVRALAVHVRPGSTVLRADELQVLADGRVRIFYADGPSGGIGSRISADGGLTWTSESGVRKTGAGFDPSVFKMADGSWRLLF